MKLILLNGPPRSGKDTAAKIIQDYFGLRWTVVHDKFSAPHKAAFAAMISGHYDAKHFRVWDYEEHKEKPIPLLNNASFRQWQIDFSEKFMKPLYGGAIFAKLFLERRTPRMRDEGMLCVVSDCGFRVEYETVADAWPHEDLLLLVLRRPGYDFSKDSRHYVEVYESDGASFCVIDNGGTLKDLEIQLLNVVTLFIGAHPYDQTQK